MWRTLVRGLGCLGYLAGLGVIFALASYAAFSLFVRGGVTAVPDLKGLAEAEAGALLADQGLRASFADDTRFDEKVLKGHVLIQDPRAGVYVKRNTEVVLTLSRGPRRIEVPSVVGQAVQAAQVSLAAAGLQVGRTFEVWSAQGRRGAVESQHPPAGERVEVEAAVDLFVDEVVLSFAQIYAKTRRNTDRAAARHSFAWQDPPEEDKRSLLVELSEIARSRGLSASLCSQPELLGEGGLFGGPEPARCIDAQRLSDVANAWGMASPIAWACS